MPRLKQMITQVIPNIIASERAIKKLMTKKPKLIIVRMADNSTFKTILLNINTSRDDQNTVRAFLFIFLTPLDDFIGIKVV